MTKTLKDIEKQFDAFNILFATAWDKREMKEHYLELASTILKKLITDIEGMETDRVKFGLKMQERFYEGYAEALDTIKNHIQEIMR